MTLYQILALSIPLLLASFGALASEYAGRMAIFMEGAINLGAFLCFAFSVLTGSVTAGVILSLAFCTAIFALLSRIIEKNSFNPFIISLAINLLCSGLISFLSVMIFGTRGVLTHPTFFLDAATVRLVSTITGCAMVLISVIILFTTKQGLYLRITASDDDVLEKRGINTQNIRIASWGIAAFFAAAAGCVFALRLNSFVPGIASGTGWIALAAVFLGKKNTAAVIGAVFLFTGAQFAASNLQNFTSFVAVPSSILLALPYAVALVCILFSKRSRS